MSNQSKNTGKVLCARGLWFATLACEGEMVSAIVEHEGIGDYFESDELPKERGFWVWEGEVEAVTYPVGDYGGPPYESSIVFYGDWRKANTSDLVAFGLPLEVVT